MLKPVDMSKAWLAPLGGDTAVRAVDYHGKAAESVWLPNEAVAKAWMEYVKTGPVGDATPPPAPSTCGRPKMGSENRNHLGRGSGLREWHRNFIVLRDGGEAAQVPRKPVGTFGRPLFQSMTYHDTPDQPMPKMRFVDTLARADQEHAYAIISVNSVGLKSEPVASNRRTARGDGPVDRLRRNALFSGPGLRFRASQRRDLFPHAGEVRLEPCHFIKLT